MKALGNWLADLRWSAGRAVSRAWDLIEAGRDEEAARLCRSVLERNPAHAGALHCSGVLALRQGRFADAVGLLRQALHAEQSARQIRYDLAEACRLTGLWEEAGAHYECVLADEPDMLAARIGLAECLFSRGEFRGASALCNDMLGAEPGNCRVLILSAELSLQGEQISGLHDRLRAAIEQYPEDGSLRLGLIKGLLARHAFEQAAAAMRQLPAALEDDYECTLVRLAAAEARRALAISTHGGAKKSAGHPSLPNLISVVICSIDQQKFAAITKHFRERFADEAHEIIGIHDARSLCEGYNRGANQARGDIVIFAHDDIEILTPDFAPRLRQHLYDHDVVGACGTSKLSSAFWMDARWPYLHGLVAHHYPEGHAQAGQFRVMVMDASGEEATGGMQALDGMFIAVNRGVLEKCRFDEQTFDGFHLYDLDFTFSAHLAGFDVAVFRDITLVHYTYADADGYEAELRRYASRFLEKYRGRLAVVERQDRRFIPAVFQAKEEVSRFCSGLLALRRAIERSHASRQDGPVAGWP